MSISNASFRQSILNALSNEAINSESSSVIIVSIFDLKKPNLSKIDKPYNNILCKHACINYSSTSYIFIN